MNSLIMMHDICVSYNLNQPNQVDALRNINISIESGGKYAVVGPSGSGKTTLLNVMGGLLKPTSGTYHFNGTNILDMTDKQLALLRNQTMGFVLQDFGLLADRTALENVCVPLLLSNTAFSAIKPKALEIMSKVGIADLAKKHVNQLSGGEAQRVAIARSLVLSPLILFADEPTGALDSYNSEKIMNLFAEYSGDNTTLVMVTHNLSLAKKCDFILEINDGSLVKK